MVFETIRFGRSRIPPGGMLRRSARRQASRAVGEEPLDQRRALVAAHAGHHGDLVVEPRVGRRGCRAIPRPRPSDRRRRTRAGRRARPTPRPRTSGTARASTTSAWPPSRQPPTPRPRPAARAPRRGRWDRRVARARCAPARPPHRRRGARRPRRSARRRGRSAARASSSASSMRLGSISGAGTGVGCVAIEADPIGSRVRLARMSWAYGDVIVHREFAWGRPWIGDPRTCRRRHTRPARHATSRPARRSATCRDPGRPRPGCTRGSPRSRGRGTGR